MLNPQCEQWKRKKNKKIRNVGLSFEDWVNENVMKTKILWCLCVLLSAPVTFFSPGQFCIFVVNFNESQWHMHTYTHVNL